MGPGWTSTVHGCLVRQEGCGWPDTTTTHKKCTAHSNMVAEQVLTYGLVERTAWLLFVNVSVMTAGLRVDCAWTVAALVAGDLDVYRINAVVESLRQDLELVEVRKSLEFAEIRRRLQDAEVELVKLRQSVPKSPSEPLVLRSGEKWLVLEMLPEVDLSFRPRVPEFMET